jgi:hypothetical protein
LPFLACGKGAISAKDFPAAFARAVCQVEQTCRGEADYLEQDCENGSRALYDPDLAKALAAGKVTFDAQQAQACLDGLHARGCGRTAPEIDQACERAVRGTLAQGQPCNWLFECAQGRCESSAPGACPAKCGAVASEGLSCGTTPCDLRAGLRCIDNVCGRLHAADAKCSGDGDCALGLYCDGFGQCSAQAFEQASCAGSDQCAAGLFCDLGAEGGLCRKRFTQGRSCTAAGAEAIAFACVDGQVCKGFRFAKTGATPGACAPTGEMGSGCVASAQITGCAGGLRCQAAVCADKPSSGACTTNADCKDGVAFCNGTHCQLLGAAGAACASSDQCASRFCEPSSGKCVENDPACHEP